MPRHLCQAFKTAYGRYISADPDAGEVTARTEAMGVRELWQPMEQGDGIFAFRSNEKKFLCAARPGMPAVADATSPDTPGVLFRVHSSASLEEKAQPKGRGEYDIVEGSLDATELGMVKKFQSFRSAGSTLHDVSGDDRRKLKKAKNAGKLHEELLDRRSKMKHDKFC